MNRLIRFFFSMSFSGALLMLFAIAVGAATFIENDFGTPAAQAVVYKSLWFEIMMVALAASMTGRIFIQKLYNGKQWPNFLFHFSFVVILIGAGITRFIGYETTMPINEGQTTNEMLSEGTYLQYSLRAGTDSVTDDEKLLYSELSKPYFKNTENIDNKKVVVKYRDFIPNAAETVVEDPTGGPVLSLVISAGEGRENAFVKQGTKRVAGSGFIRFDAPFDSTGVNISLRGDSLVIYSPDSIQTLSMATQISTNVAPKTWLAFVPMMLFQTGGTSIVLQKFLPHGGIKLVAADKKQGSFHDALLVDLTVGDKTTSLELFGKSGMRGIPVSGEFGGVHYTFEYGSKVMKLPFSIHLVDFQLERYPGSQSPSSFASEVELIDPQGNPSKFPYRIFMNHVLDYGGYRFFQASYPPDEKGTILSVNHDRFGTYVTYLGYTLMSLGMFLTIFNKNSRFQGLGRKSAALHKRRAGTLGVILLMFFGSAANAQSDTLVTTAVDAQMAAKFGQLLVQDNGGRVKPVNTVASELLRKIYRQTSYRSLTADQVLLDMIRRPQLWQNELLIKVSHPDLQALVGAKDGYASFANFVNMHSEENYIIRKQVEAAFAKQPAYRDKLDKDLIAVDERVNILYMMLSGQILRIFPLPNDSAHTWYTPNDGAVFEKDASLFVKNILPIYFESIEQGAQQHNFADADTIFSKIQAFQAKFGKDVFPSESKLKTEILYNKLNIFERIWMYYFLFGFLQLIASFARVLKPTLNIKWPNRIFTTAIFLLFVAHIIGLTMRWYISGHAPWSNGYESMIYIGFATMLSGFLFVKRSPIVVAATAILTSMILMVAHLSWLDPEITNLVPVLKSYWLTIHVAIITASYGFLGLAAILAFINLLLYNFKTDKNQSKLELTIQELTVVNEMTMQIGLFMLTIGTFLGGVWANESWGRYWGWDPKETWALATVLFYAFVSHMRLIPGLRGAFALNLGALLAFSSVLMTYFGVNYYLAGLHSYAKGDPVPIPSFVYYALIVVFSVSLMAWITQRKYRAISDEER